MVKFSNTKPKGKRFLAWLLAAALVAGTPGQAAYASEGDSAVPTAAEDMPEVLAHFDFENEAQICSPDSGPEDAEAQGFVDKDEDGNTRALAKIMPKDADNNAGTISDAAVGYGAADLLKDVYLDVVKITEDGTESSLLSGHDALTISYYSKSAIASDDNKWAYWAGPEDYIYSGNKETILSMADRSNYLEESRLFKNSAGGLKIVKNDFSNTGWKQVTVVMDESTTTVYMDGIKIGSMEDEPALGDILGENSSFYIGGAKWDNIEYFNGLIDEFIVYGGALTEDQVVAEYLNNKSDDEIKAYLKDYVDGQIDAQVIKGDSKRIAVSDLTLPTSYSGATITWTSSKADVIANSGELIAYDGSNATLTAVVSYASEKLGKTVTDSLSYEITACNEEGFTLSQDLKAFVASGSQTNNPNNSLFISCKNDQENNKNGNEHRAAFINGETSNISKNANLLGSTRIGGIQFAISETLALNAEMIDSATLTARVDSAHSNLGSYWTKAAVFETSNPDVLSIGSQTDLPPKNKDYSYDATMWSNERIYKNKVTKLNDSGTEEEVADKTITFDVTKALKNAIADGKKTVVLRLQTVSGGYYLYEKGQEGAPALSVNISRKSDVTVNYVSEGKELKSKTIENQKVGTSYTYEVQDDEKILTTADGVYVRDETSADNALTVARINRDSSQNTVTVAYKKQTITEITPPEDDIYIIAGNTPVFPAQLTAKTNAGTNLTVDVDWPDKVAVDDKETALKDLTAGTYEIIGKVGTNEVKVNLQVLECDEDVGTTEAKNADTVPTYKLSRAYTGTIVAEFDVEVTSVTGIPTNDQSVIYTDLANNNGDWTKASGPRIDFGGSGSNEANTPFFKSQSGDGKGNGTGNYPAKGGQYQKADGFVKTEAGKTYRFRIEIDDATSGGLYRTYITEEDGTVTKLFEGAGSTFRGWTGAGIQNYMAVRGGFTMKNHKISWTSGWSKYAVKTYVDDKCVETETFEKELAGTKHSDYKPAAIYKSEDGKKFFLNEATSGWEDGKFVAGDKETIVYNAYYEPCEIASQVGTIELKTRVGYAPELPETTTAEYENKVRQEEEVEWDEITPSKYAQPGIYKATGKFKGTEIAVEATVTVVSLESIRVAEYNFDDNLTDASANHAAATTTENVTYTKGLDGKAVSLPGGAKNAGHINLPGTLSTAENENKIPDDFTLSFFTKRGNNTSSYVVALGVKDTSNYIGLTNRNDQFRTELRKTGGNKDVEKNGHTPENEWVHIAVVVKGTTGEAWLYENGSSVGYGKDVKVKMSDLAGGSNYIGYSPWAVSYDNDDYEGDVDKFAIYGADLTAAEIKDICNKTLYELQVNKTKEVLEQMITDGNFSYKDGSGKINKDEVDKDISLPITLDDDEAGIGTTITWKSSDNGYVADNGDVYQPSKGENDQEVTLTATIKAGQIEETVDFVITVKEGNKLNFTSLKNAITETEEQYYAADAKKVYAKASLETLEKKIDAAKAIALYDGQEEYPDTITYNTINEARQALETALNALELKGFDELNESEVLKVYYPLTENAKDASGNNKNGTATGVTFSEAEGAHFTESKKALTSCIQIPNTIDVTDEMTFSFWAKDERGTKSNAFGIGSGDSFSNSGNVAKFFYISTHDNGNLLASVNTKYWSEATNISTPAAAKDAWHHVTGVLSGKTLTLYVDGVKIGSKETKATLTEIWNHHPASRNIYIGNCSYGIRTSDADPDYQGNIRDFRIYGAAIEASQVAEVYGHMVGEYKEHLSAAKAGIVTAILGADVQAGADGTYSYQVPRTVTSLTLPKTMEDDWVKPVQWQSNSNSINVETGTITLAEAEKTVTLTATITVGNQTEDVIIKCILPKQEANKGALEATINTAKALTKADYTDASWDAMQEKLTDANSVYGDGAATPTQVENARKALATAIANLVPKTKEALNTAIKNAENFIKTETESKSEYPADKWSELESALADAKDVYADADATGDEITTATETLTDAMGAMKKTSVIEQETAKEELGTSLTTARTDVQELGITEDNAAQLASTKVWNNYSAALTAAQELDETASAADLNAAKENLDNALAELKETVQNKKDLNTAITEASELTAADFEDDTAWETFQSALEAANTAVGDSDATSSSLKAALGTLNDALQAKKPPVTDEVTLSLNPTALPLEVGETATITANVTPADTTVEWSSDKPGIATVDQTGKVTAVSAGTATITAKAGDKTATCTVTVTVPAKPTVKVKKVKITESLSGGTKPAVAAGKKITLKAAITPSNASNQKVTWSVDTKSKKYASISAKGVLSTKKTGAGKTVIVTATAKDGSKKKATIKVKIMKNAVTKVSLKAGKKTVKAGKKITVKATVGTNGKKANKTLAWSIDKKSAKYASINSKGVLSTKKTGKGKTVTVTATATDGTKKKATIKIKITK